MKKVRFSTNSHTNEKSFMVSDHRDEIVHDKWFLKEKPNGKGTAKKPTISYYVCRGATKAEQATGWPKQVELHRFLLGLKKGDKRIGDHIDHNTLNNTDENLRIKKDIQGNSRNRHDAVGGTLWGAHFLKKSKKWAAQFSLPRNGEFQKQAYAGTFDNEAQAHLASLDKWIELVGKAHHLDTRPNL